MVKRLARFAVRYARDPVYRESLRLARERPAGLFQPLGWTEPERYPRIFRAARKALAGRPEPRLLSFGCATGEEIASLRRAFPDAVIKGIDINAESIVVCRTLFASDSSVELAIADSTSAEPDAAYDAIFCMAVLRQGALGTTPPPRCDHLIRFGDFERAIADFARMLRPGGLLALRHSNFRLEDTSIAARFEPLLDASRFRDTPKYGPDNTLLPDTPREQALWRKLD
jgi:SAM-dependent methyltransferase